MIDYSANAESGRLSYFALQNAEHFHELIDEDRSLRATFVVRSPPSLSRRDDKLIAEFERERIAWEFCAADRGLELCGVSQL